MIKNVDTCDNNPKSSRMCQYLHDKHDEHVYVQMAAVTTQRSSSLIYSKIRL